MTSDSAANAVEQKKKTPVSEESNKKKKTPKIATDPWRRRPRSSQWAIKEQSNKLGVQRRLV